MKTYSPRCSLDKPVATPSLFLWQMFSWSPFVSFVCLHFYSEDALYISSQPNHLNFRCVQNIRWPFNTGKKRFLQNATLLNRVPNACFSSWTFQIEHQASLNLHFMPHLLLILNISFNTIILPVTINRSLKTSQPWMAFEPFLVYLV